LTKIAIHPSVEIAWNIANIEACHSGSERIEPIHFLLGALKIMDENFYSEAESIDVSPQLIESVVRMASQCRSAVRMSSEGIKIARRGIRKMLRRRGEAGPVHMLHRSGASRYLFQKAGRRAHKLGSDELTLVHLFEELMSDLPPDASPFIQSRLTDSPSDSEEWPSYIPDPFGR